MSSTAPTAIITGSGSGIGRATAIELARQGFDLVLAGRTKASLSETARLVESSGRIAGRSATAARAHIHTADLSTADANRAMIDACVRTFGRLDVLVNNAGQAQVASIPESTPELIDRTFRVNTLGPAYAIHFAWPHLMKSAREIRGPSLNPSQREGQGEGGPAASQSNPPPSPPSGRGVKPAIVNVSSIATVDPFPGFFAYGASKAALNLLTQSAAKEGTDVGIRAFCIAPGAVETPMLRSAFDESMVPKSQALTPEAVARIILDCVLGKHDAHNGRVIPVLPESAKAWYRDWMRDHPPIDSI